MPDPTKPDLRLCVDTASWLRRRSKIHVGPAHYAWALCGRGPLCIGRPLSSLPRGLDDPDVCKRCARSAAKLLGVELGGEGKPA